MLFFIFLWDSIPEELPEIGLISTNVLYLAHVWNFGNCVASERNGRLSIFLANPYKDHFRPLGLLNWSQGRLSLLFAARGRVVDRLQYRILYLQTLVVL